MDTLIIHSETEKTKSIIAFLEKLKVSFEIKKEKENPYDPKFVAKIERSRQQAAEGKGRVITVEELDALCK